MKTTQAPLFRRDFTLVVIGQIISLFGNAILRFALPLYLLRQTGSPALFGAVGAAAFVTYIRAVILRDTGATLSPFHAFIFLQGLETLSLRVERHVSNALKIVDYLSKHPQVEAVHHPSLESEPSHGLYQKYLPNGGGSIFTFEIKGDAATAQKFIDSLAIFSLLANVADVKSLVIHPATTTHSQCTEEELLDQGIRPNTIRLSIGIEKAEDLIAALDAAFEAVK